MRAFLGCLLFSLAATALTAAEATTKYQPLPAPDTRPVNFKGEVLPILAHNCFECHAHGKRKGGLSLDSKEAILNGGETGPAAISGKSAVSLLIKRIAGHVKDADEIMPPKKKTALTPQEIGILRTWIDKGIVWDAAANLGSAKKYELALKKVSVPEGTGNPIDRVLAAYTKNQIKAEPISDALYARRVYLDLHGILPTPEQLNAFMSDTKADKREKLVETLLANNASYADHWISFWQDHLRDGKKDLGTTDVFVPIGNWIYESLLTNKAYDQFTRELINPPTAKQVAENKKAGHENDGDGGDGEVSNAATAAKVKKDEVDAKDDKNDPSGFIKGLQAGLEKPKGAERWEMQAAQNVGQVFLGIKMKCATCHDSFTDHWSMQDTWGIASIFADKPIEMVRCELPTGRTAPPHFMYPELGQIDAAAPRIKRMEQLASLVTLPTNGRYARTVVNRLWAKLMGRGLIEPVDEMENDAWSPELLDWLAADLVEHRFDLKRTIGLIATSNAYQMPAVDDKLDAPAAYVFRGPLLRRMTAEQLIDSTHALLGKNERAWRTNGNHLLEVLGRPDHRVIATSRISKASPIQAMEMLNGRELNRLIYEKAPALTPLDQLFLHALSRKPTEKEETIFKGMVDPASKDGAQGDWVWVLTMLPEFQLIR